MDYSSRRKKDLFSEKESNQGTSHSAKADLFYLGIPIQSVIIANVYFETEQKLQDKVHSDRKKKRLMKLEKYS